MESREHSSSYGKAGNARALRVRNGAENTRALDAESETGSTRASRRSAMESRTLELLVRMQMSRNREHSCFARIKSREHSHSRKSPRTLELRRSRICLDRLAPGRYILRGLVSEWWPRAAAFAIAWRDARGERPGRVTAGRYCPTLYTMSHNVLRTILYIICMKIYI